MEILIWCARMSILPLHLGPSWSASNNNLYITCGFDYSARVLHMSIYFQITHVKSTLLVIELIMYSLHDSKKISNTQVLL